MSCCSKPNKKDDQNQGHSHGHSHDHSKSSCCSSKKEEKSNDHGHNHDLHKGSSCCSEPKKDTSSQKITRQLTIQEILDMFPFKAQKLSQEITNAGLHCVGCHAATWETLEAGMISHGKTNEQIDKLTERLNILLNEEVDYSQITMTPRGAAKFLEIAADENKLGWGVRFSEEMAGCNGFEYVLDFSEHSDDDDKVIESNGIEIHVKKALLPRLMGCEIDYVDGLRGSGFKVTNPNVRSSCGCGTSHGY